MSTAVQTITATILIQVGPDQPKPIGTIEIPIEVSVGSTTQKMGLSFPVGARGIPDDEAMTAEQVRARYPLNPLGAH